MTCQLPYTDGRGCLVTPSCAGTSYQPAKLINQPILDWNAGADSITEVSGNAHAQWNQPAGVFGVIIGFKRAGQSVTLPSLITHGFYYTSVAGVAYAQIVESGQLVGSAFTYASSDTFELDRDNGQVTYTYNGTLLYTSQVLSFDTIVVNACLYGSGDQAPSLGGGALAASFTVSNPTSSTVTLTDTSTGANIAWRSWAFSSMPLSYQWIYADIENSSGTVFAPFQVNANVSGSVINSPEAITYVSFTSPTSNNTVTLTVTDTLGNTSTASQTFSTLG